MLTGNKVSFLFSFLFFFLPSLPFPSLSSPFDVSLITTHIPNSHIFLLILSRFASLFFPSISFFFLTRRYIDVSLSSWKIWCNDIGGRTSLCILTVSFVWRDFSTANWAGSTFYHEVAFVYHTRTQMLLPVYRSKDETKCCALFPFSLKIRSANKKTRLARCFLEFTKESREGEKFAGLRPYSNSTDNETN